MNQDINKPTTESHRAAIPASDRGDCPVGGEPRAREADVFASVDPYLDSLCLQSTYGAAAGSVLTLQVS
jgi:hypothetical protein